MIITVTTPQSSSPITIVTNVTTWGELKSILTDKGIRDIDNMKGMVRQGRITLEHREAILPTTDFELFLFTVNIKAGNNTLIDRLESLKEELIDKIDDIFNDTIIKIENKQFLSNSNNDLSEYEKIKLEMGL